MKALVVGASGATGRLLVKQLLEIGNEVKAIVRSADKFRGIIGPQENLTVTQANLLDLSDDALAEQVAGCTAVASCLGHNLTFKGVFGKPRRLVTDSVRRLCQAVKANRPTEKVKFVLMNTAGNSNRDLNERVSFAQTCVIKMLRLLVPPHPDNEQAADFLRTQIGQDDGTIEWVAVRPDGLINKEDVSPYELHESPTRSAIFNAGKTSRINVAAFMAKLINDDQLWQQWKGKMPVIYNCE